MSDEQPTKFEGFYIPKKNFFHMPNNWTDITADIDSLAELKIVEYVARHTWGFQEYGVFKTISVDEFMSGRKQKKKGPDGKDIIVRMDRGTGLTEPSVKDGLKRAIKDGYLVCQIDDKDKGRVKKSYALRMLVMNEEGGKNLTGQESYPVSNLPSGVKNLTPRGKESYPRTEKETKESNSRKTKRENALSSIDETRTLSSSNSSSSITDEAIPSQAPSSEQRDTTQPLTAEDEVVTPPTPKNGSQAQEKASAQADGVSDSQKNTGKDASGKGNRGSRKRSSKKNDVDLDAIVPVPPPDAPASDMPWSARKAILWADHFRGFAYPESNQPKSKYCRVRDAVILIVQRGIPEEQYVYMFRFMKGLLPNGLKSDYWSEHEVDAWTVNDHWEDQVKEIKRKSGSLRQATQAVAAFAEAGVKPGMRMENGKLVIDSNKTVSGLNYFNIPSKPTAQRGA